MRKLALLAVFLALPLFGADQTPPKATTPAPIPSVSDSSARAILSAERDILTVGRNMDKLVSDYKNLQSQQETAQKALQDAVAAAYKAAGDPDKTKYDLNIETLVFSAKPAQASSGSIPK